MPDLEYEPTPAARGAFVERDGAVTRVVVPMAGLYVPMPAWVRGGDIVSLVIGPIVWLAVLAVQTVLAMPKPPRAFFEVDATTLRMTLCEPSTGERSQLAWPRAAVVEVRQSRYESGLWIHVSGHVKDTYLPDLPRRTIAQIESMLAAALRRDGTATPT